MATLIISHHSDVNALAVKVAGANRGMECHYIPVDIYPFADLHSFNTDASGVVASFSSVPDIDIDDVSAVWFRRRAITRAFDYCKPWSDEDFRRRTISAYAHGLYEWLAVHKENALWVNSTKAAAAANSKLLQLKIAVKIGFKVPRTLISNDPVRIRRFLQENEGNIVKSFIPFGWTTSEGRRIVALTSEIGLLDAENDESLSLQPAIYQEKINKKYEIRLTVFGEYEFAIKIDSQNRDEMRIDWRQAQPSKNYVSGYEMPMEIRIMVQKFMSKIGIRFGCFDFVVDENGNYIFLEVNEAGQFLWVEKLHSEYAMLDAFTAFLSGIPRMKWRPMEKNRLENVQSSDQYNSLSERQKDFARKIKASPINEPF